MEQTRRQGLTGFEQQGKAAVHKGAQMFVLHSYAWAVVFCVITMLCWGSWANLQKLTKKGWRFELLYWDFTIGVLLLSLILGLTLGSSGSVGRPFLEDLHQASHSNIHSALLGGAIFNLANILL